MPLEVGYTAGRSLGVITDGAAWRAVFDTTIGVAWVVRAVGIGLTAAVLLVTRSRRRAAWWRAVLVRRSRRRRDGIRLRGSRRDRPLALPRRVPDDAARFVDGCVARRSHHARRRLQGRRARWSRAFLAHRSSGSSERRGQRHDSRDPPGRFARWLDRHVVRQVVDLEARRGRRDIGHRCRRSRLDTRSAGCLCQPPSAQPVPAASIGPGFVERSPSNPRWRS